MSYVLSQIQRVLIRRCGRKLAYAHLDSTTVETLNPDLSDPMASGLSSLGYPVADPSEVTEADLLPLQGQDVNQFLDVAEWRCLESILGNRASPDQMAGTDNRQDHGKFYEALEKTVARRREELERQYGIGLSPLTPGVFDLGFQERVDSNTGRVI